MKEMEDSREEEGEGERDDRDRQMDRQIEL